MRACRPLLAVLLLAWSAAGQNNPISNGGFEQGLADWEVLGAGRLERNDVHSGSAALRLVRDPATRGETGLNRAWTFGAGEQGRMLAERRGGIRFWYKAVAARPADTLTIQIIAMSDRSQETAHRTVWRLPTAHVGDGKWHQGALAYDYTGDARVRWVHVSSRLVGDAGELLLDDLEWVAAVGPIVQSGGLVFHEVPGLEGEQARLALRLVNLGDQPAPAGHAVLVLPAGLKTPSLRLPTPVVPAGKTADVVWPLNGRRDHPPYELAASAVAGGQMVDARVTLAPALELVGLRSDRLVLLPGQSNRVRLVVRNAGSAFGPAPSVALRTPAGVTAVYEPGHPPVRPGTEAVLAAWKVAAARPAPFAMLRATAAGMEGEAATPLVVPGAKPEPLPATGNVYAAVQGGQAQLGNRRVRLLLRGGVGLLQVAGAAGWRDVAWMPHFGLVADGTGEHPVGAGSWTSTKVPGGAGLRLAARAGQWDAVCELGAKPDSGIISYRIAVTPRQDAALRALEGPVLYAGEGDRTPRDDAVVPGLEWLVRGESSSNALDIVPDHPDRLRYVPHPSKVTIPAVGLRFGDRVLGLLWDVPADQPSCELAGPANLIFASPDRFEGQAAHLVGLSLPAVGRGMPENGRRATTPLKLPKGQALTLRAELFAAAGAKDALAAVDGWIARHGYPQPLPFPRGRALKEVEFSLQGYFKDTALWNPQWKKWYSDLIVGFQPWDGAVNELLFGAELLGENRVAERARALAMEVSGADDRAARLRVEYRCQPGALAELARQARSTIATQAADGTWRFGGEKAGSWPKGGVNYAVLGPVGASESGLTARKAAQVLDCAVLTGDPEAAKAGLKALAALRRFTVPRAAQVWEVPVHTPDILASADCVDAFVKGYQLTGDAAWLKDAHSWARSGLPFVYVWHPDNLKAMQGGSIPVFGATGYGLSWFAVLVQWNGLAYANALLDLSRYDTSFPWSRVAENLLRSAMYQQAVSGDRWAQWPDAYNLIAGRPGAHGQTPPCFTPSSVLNLTWRFLGLRPSPEVAVVRQGARRLTLRGEASFGGAGWQGDALSFAVRFTPPQRGAVEVIGTAKPTNVKLDGHVLAEAADVWAEDKPAWHYHADASTVEIRILDTGRHLVGVSGVKRVRVAVAPSVLKSIAFRFDKSLQGWAAQHDLTPLRLEGGCLRADTTGGDPYMAREGLLVQGKPGDVLVVRLALGGGQAGGSVFWATLQGGFSPQRELPYICAADGAIHEVRVPVGANQGWAGQTITGLRLDPGGGPPGFAVRVESVTLERKP
ncbi:MAG: hypothetical protein HYU66_17350 [Armatimonadetes bacterium]|nr:hypothetical protein [Armatimonadota bacterium]